MEKVVVRAPKIEESVRNAGKFTQKVCIVGRV